MKNYCLLPLMALCLTAVCTPLNATASDVPSVNQTN